MGLPDRENIPWIPERGVSLRTIGFEKESESTGVILLEFNKSVQLQSVGVSKTTGLTIGIAQQTSSKVATKSPPPDFTQVAPARTVDANLERIMGKAKTAMADKDYGQAILHYETVLSFSYNQFGEEAMEYLGLARERNGQFASAETVYRKYLDKYPKGEGTAGLSHLKPLDISPWSWYKTLGK